MIEARFGHVNLIARDWRRLGDFYERVLGCVFVPPERNLRGPIVEAGTGVPGAVIRGGHYRLPGLALDGPTLEIFEYVEGSAAPPVSAASSPVANRPGFGHIAFAVPNVEAARDAFLAEGGTSVGEVVSTETADGRVVTWAYVADPEGNIVELQAWSDAER